MLDLIYGKSVLLPMTISPIGLLEWLSIVWGIPPGTIRISGRRLSSIADCVERMSQKRFIVSARELASFVGKFISASAEFGNISRIMTRYCTISVAAVKDWDSKFSFDQ